MRYFLHLRPDSAVSIMGAVWLSLHGRTETPFLNASPLQRLHLVLSVTLGSLRTCCTQSSCGFEVTALKHWLKFVTLLLTGFRASGKLLYARHFPWRGFCSWSRFFYLRDGLNRKTLLLLSQKSCWCINPAPSRAKAEMSLIDYMHRIQNVKYCSFVCLEF